jgi:hypothetical protein
MKFKTKLWKRSEKSFATTIPHIVLLSMDESKKQDVIWEYDPKLGKWTLEVKQSKSQPKQKVKND